MDYVVRLCGLNRTTMSSVWNDVVSQLSFKFLMKNGYLIFWCKFPKDQTCYQEYIEIWIWQQMESTLGCPQLAQKFRYLRANKFRLTFIMEKYQNSKMRKNDSSMRCSDILTRYDGYETSQWHVKFGSVAWLHFYISTCK